MNSASHSAPLAILLVNWNTCGLLLDCLKSLRGAGPATEFHVTVVDNASSDESVASVKSAFPEVRVLEMPENLGFARGNNAVLRALSSEYVLLLNPDTRVLQGAIDRLLADLATDHRLAAVGAQLLNPDGTLQASWGVFPSLVREFPFLRPFLRSHNSRVTPGSDALRLVDWAKGACLLIRGEALKQVGLLDEAYYLYTEEADWCYRARRLGWEIGVDVDARIVHIEQASSRQRTTRSMIDFYRSRALFVAKHRSTLQARGLWLVTAVKSLAWSLFARPLAIGEQSSLSAGERRAAYSAVLFESLRGIVRPVRPAS